MDTLIRFRQARVGLMLVATLLALLLTNLLPEELAQAQTGQPALSPAFETLWQRNDQAVLTGAAQRSWLWGPASFAVLDEPYAGFSGAARAVAYYDKGRMEAGDSQNGTGLTSGLLVREMVTGNVQVGSNNFEQKSPALVPIAGDLISNPNSPTYATFRNLASLNFDHRATNLVGAAVTTEIDNQGKLTTGFISNYSVKNAFYEPTLGHNIPDVFANFFASHGLIYQEGRYQDAPLFNQNNQNWIYWFGLPLTEPIWTETLVMGQPTLVLVQLFERRVLTYTPTNTAGWQVEMGNVGRSYFNWRYTPSVAAAPPVLATPIFTPTPSPTSTTVEPTAIPTPTATAKSNATKTAPAPTPTATSVPPTKAAPVTAHTTYQQPQYSKPAPHLFRPVAGFVPPSRPVAGASNNAATGSWLLDNTGQYYVLTLANPNIQREVVVPKNGGGPYTTSLYNSQTKTEYVTQTNNEFWLVLSHELAGDPSTSTLTSENFDYVSSNWVTQSRGEQEIQINFVGEFQDVPINLALFYDVQANTNFVRKWLTIQPFNAPGWAIKYVTLEDWQAKDGLQAVTPTPRYNQTFDGYQPIFNTGTSSDQLNLQSLAQRFSVAANSGAVAVNIDNGQGMFFFDESLFGQENFSKGNLMLSNADYVLTSAGFTSGRAVVGFYAGPAEIGFKRYGEYLYNQYAAIKNKKDPVWFSTWYVYQEQINSNVLSNTINQMSNAGFYDMLHIDAGWEANGPLQVNPIRFPQGLDQIVNQATSAGLRTGFWMNPFSNYYSYITDYAAFRSQHPTWVDQTGTMLCPLSGAGQYIHDRLIQLAQSWPLEEIYWDGADWNITNCLSADRPFQNADQEHIMMVKYYASLLYDLHQVRPDLRVIIWNWNAPQDVHWLAAVDQIQLSDIPNPPIGFSELIRRQQLYYATFERPYAGIWGDWYGLAFQKPNQLNLPLSYLETAEVEMIGNGATEAGGGFDLAAAPAELVAFVNQMFTFRKQYAPYFSVYQHVLNFPDGRSIDGEAHMIGGRGFIMLFNPTPQAQTINVPLNEAELELLPGATYNLNDWSNLSNAVPLASVTTTSQVSVTVPGYGYKIIGVNMPNS